MTESTLIQRIAALLVAEGAASPVRAERFALVAVAKAQAFHDRLLAKCEEREDGCWAWVAYRNAEGYGVVMTPEGKAVHAHRVMYEEFVGPIPDEFEIDHLCRVRECVNPAHLEAVTKRENVLRGEGVGAKCARRTACKHDHPYVDGSYRMRGNARICILCSDGRSTIKEMS